MNMIDKFLLSELNVAGYVPNVNDMISDDEMCAAITLNENLAAYGYTLSPKDICNIATSPSRDGFVEKIGSLLPDVKAEPMYPDFPKYVMEISEAEFRFHQILHYFSTYGMEFLTGEMVTAGWLPKTQNTKKTQNDTRLVDLKVIELVAEDEKCDFALKRILGKTEPMTIPEQELICAVIGEVSIECLETVKVKYKDNIPGLFDKALELDSEASLKVMRAVCQHSGDALDNIYRVLIGKKFHLKTSEKKRFVKLLEMYSVPNFRGNLMLSRKLRERNLQVLQGLDYNMYSRSLEHKQVVADLRDDKIKSWSGIATKKILEREEDALEFIAQRPGMMLRMVNWLLGLDFDADEIEKCLSKDPASFNTRTLIKVLTGFLNQTEESIRLETEEKISQVKYACERGLNLLRYNKFSEEMERKLLDVEFKYKRVNEEREAIKRKYDEQYRKWVPITILVKFEAELENLRKKHIRVYHVKSQDYERLVSLKNEKKTIGREIKKLEKSSLSEKTVDGKMAKYYGVEQDVLRLKKVHSKKRKITDMNRLKNLKEKSRQLSEKIRQLEETGDFADIIKKEVIDCSEKEAKILERRDAQLAIADEKRSEIKNKLEQELMAYDKEHAFELENKEKEVKEIKEEYGKYIEDYQRSCEQKAKDLIQERDEKIKIIEEARDNRIKALDRMPVKRRILANVLRNHLVSIDTPLRDKKVYTDFSGYDFAHSVFSMKDKSDDGGYIPSGIAYKIPDEAKYVRFFVYWNDVNRVDIDLHANGFDVEGNSLHIGWNADFRKCGVIHSGDITHSDAAEFIDIDLSQPIDKIFTNIHLFSGKSGLDEVEECYVGMMAVNEIGEEVKLYDRANCFFAHEMHQKARSIKYGYVDVQNRYVKFIGKPGRWGYNEWHEDEGKDVFSIEKYLNLLLESQGVEVVETPEQADVVLSVGKSMYENGISLIDESFFMDVDK